LAWVIAVFLELAVFSDTISEKIKRDHVAVNRPVYAKIEQYEAQLAGEIEERRTNLVALEELRRRELALDHAPPARSDDREPQIRALAEEIANLDALEQDLRSELRQVEERVVSYAEDMNAEELGQRINPTSSGRAGAGPRYQFARRQKEVYEARRTVLRNELSQLSDKRTELREKQRSLVDGADARRERDRAAAQGQRDAFLALVEAARAELKELEASRAVKVEAFRRNAVAASDFQKQKDDPLSRMTAYQELKSDPKDGATITLFSWMTRFLVIFLEIVPVVAKMFFSPPSVYAAKIQAQVEREREKARLAGEAPLAASAAEAKIADELPRAADGEAPIAVGEPERLVDLQHPLPPRSHGMERLAADGGGWKRRADAAGRSAITAPAAGGGDADRGGELGALLRSFQQQPDPIREIEAALRAAARRLGAGPKLPAD
jgi:hypothetical protein